MTLVAERWTPSGLDPADQVDAFREAISATHLPWSLDALVDGPPGSDELTRYRIGDLTLIDCRCGPCSGSRGRSQLAATSDDVVGVLFVRSGVEYVETGESRSVVRPGAALLWRGDEPVRFALPGRLHKWTLLVPAARLPYVRSGPLDPAASALLASLLGTTLASAGSLSGRLRPAGGRCRGRAAARRGRPVVVGRCDLAAGDRVRAAAPARALAGPAGHRGRNVRVGALAVRAVRRARDLAGRLRAVVAPGGCVP